jgi:hypothetical protein
VADLRETLTSTGSPSQSRRDLRRVEKYKRAIALLEAISWARSPALPSAEGPPDVQGRDAIVLVPKTDSRCAS